MTIVEITRGDDAYCRIAVSIQEAGATVQIGRAIRLAADSPWTVLIGPHVYLTHSHTRALSRLMEAAHEREQHVVH